MAISKEGKSLEKALNAYAEMTEGWLGNVLEMLDTIASKHYFNEVQSIRQERWGSQLDAIQVMRDAAEKHFANR